MGSGPALRAAWRLQFQPYAEGVPVAIARFGAKACRSVNDRSPPVNTDDNRFTPLP